MPEPYTIFDRKRVRAHRDRAAARGEDYTFLLHEMAMRLSERLHDIKRPFPRILELGAHGGQFASYLREVPGVELFVQTDLSHAMIKNASGLRLVADEEFLPFAPETFDLILSLGSLHWVNDLPGTLIQIQRSLKPGGLFLASLPGGETLKELRASFEQAEMEVRGGISPRVSPFIDVKDAGSLLQRAGFIEPVTDSELLTVSYKSPMKLLHDLRGMGESSALLASAKNMAKRLLFSKALDYYVKQFTHPNNRVAATFEIITLTAWKK